MRGRGRVRATIEIDEKLYEEAKRLTQIKTKKDLINLSLKELIRRKRVEHLLSLFGASPIEITLEDVEEFRRDES